MLARASKAAGAVQTACRAGAAMPSANLMRAPARLAPAGLVRSFASDHEFKPTDPTPYPPPAFKKGDPAPSVFDLLVNILIIDDNGARHKLVGRVGQTLSEVARYNRREDLLVEDGDSSVYEPTTRKVGDLWTEDIYGEGHFSYHTHIIVPKHCHSMLPPMAADEDSMLDRMDRHFKGPRTPDSRLASGIFLSKDMEGLEFYVPDQYPVDSSH